MSEFTYQLDRLAGQFAPWTSAGAPDTEFEDHERTTLHALLTDAKLLTCFRRRFPDDADADYDDMVRRLGYVWDCPHDVTANMTGHCCATCGRTRADAHTDTPSADLQPRPRADDATVGRTSRRRI
jgi:hypothetical protein